VITAPARGLVFSAAGPGTARCGDQKIAARTAPAGGLVVVSSAEHGDPMRIAALLAGLRVAEHRKLSGALKFGAVAAGEADLYPRFGTTGIWDTAAGQAIIEAAGGAVNDADSGLPLRYDLAGGYDNPAFIARGRTG
jgi:3'(2'), 5'-bisphosphate nucleotidase